jgi:hypothetical protein
MTMDETRKALVALLKTLGPIHDRAAEAMKAAAGNPSTDPYDVESDVKQMKAFKDAVSNAFNVLTSEAVPIATNATLTEATQ